MIHTHDIYTHNIHILHTYILDISCFSKKETSKPMEILSDTKIKTNYFLYIFV